MAISIDSIQTLQRYLLGVLDRASHHAGNVDGVSLALLGAVIWRSDQEIKVRQYKGEPANMIWFWVNGRRYVLLYNHIDKQIELKDRSNAGNVLYTFNNRTPYNQVLENFNSL